MPLTFVTDNDTLSLDVDLSMTVDNVKAILEADSGIPAAKQILLHNGKPIADDSRSLQSYGIEKDDMIMLVQQEEQQQQRRAAGASGSRSRQAPSGSSAQQQQERQVAEELRQQLLANPQAMSQLRAQRPEVADAISSGDMDSFMRFISEQREAMIASGGSSGGGMDEAQQRAMMELASADPFDPDAQAKIEEAIRQERVMENLEHAMEYSPESFGRVTMLYVDTQVNGVEVKAFVDSGAQATIMSPECAERCGIMRLIDRRFAGIARGVGTANILGRVHSAQIRLGEKLFLPCSFTIMEGEGVELLFGLDMLKRFQAVIDLSQNALLVGEERIRFLDEHELPARARADNDGEEHKPAQKQPQQSSSSSQAAGASSSAIPVSEAARLNAEAAAGSAARTAPFPGRGQSVGTSASQDQQQSRSVSGSGVSFEHRPAAPAAPSTGSSASPAATRGPTISPEAIKSLTDLGATERQARELLQAAGGNVEVAASLLFQS